MTDEMRAQIEYRLERARTSLHAARVLLGEEHVYDAANRLYYACFYAVNALLLLEGLHSRKHTGVRALFNTHWIRPGRMPLEMGKFYQALFDSRHDVDYGDVPSIGKEEVSAMFDEAAAFVERISDEIAKTIE